MEGRRFKAVLSCDQTEKINNMQKQIGDVSTETWQPVHTKSYAVLQKHWTWKWGKGNDCWLQENHIVRMEKLKGEPSQNVVI